MQDTIQRIDVSQDPRVSSAMKMARGVLGADALEDVLNASLAAMREMYGMMAYVHVTTCGLRKGRYSVLRVFRHDFDASRGHGEKQTMETAEVHRGGFLGELVEDSTPKLVHDIDLGDDPVIGERCSDYHSAMAIPMFFRGDGADWIVVMHTEPDGCKAADVADMIVQCNLLGVMIDRDYMAKELTEATHFIRQEVEHIARIQHSLLPPEMPKIAGLDLAASYETFDRAGGDYYDILPLRACCDEPEPDAPWIFLMADASGHGPSAAVVMAMVHALLHSRATEAESPSEILEYLNENLQAHRIAYSFVTAFLGIYDPKTRTLRYSNAGHPPPIVMCPENPERMQRLSDSVGYPMGIEERIGCTDASIQLGEGQSVVLYTDGITESVSPDGEMFQIEGIEQALQTCNGKPDCVTLEVIDALKTHEAGERARDDQTLLAIHITG